MAATPNYFHPANHDGGGFAMPVSMAAFVASFAAIFPMPYAYYMGLKGFFFLATIAAMGHTLSVAGWRKQWWLIGGVAAVILYNPFLPFEFSKGWWTLWNFSGALALLVLSSPEKPTQGGMQEVGDYGTAPEEMK